MLIWSTKSWETQLLKGKVTNPHTAISKPVHVMEQVRICAVWPTDNWLGYSLNHIQGWTTVRESYSRALQQGPLSEGWRNVSSAFVKGTVFDILSIEGDGISEKGFWGACFTVWGIKISFVHDIMYVCNIRDSRERVWVATRAYRKITLVLRPEHSRPSPRVLWRVRRYAIDVTREAGNQLCVVAFLSH